MEEPTRVKSLEEAWDRLKNNRSFWLLVAILLMVPVARLLGV